MDDTRPRPQSSNRRMSESRPAPSRARTEDDQMVLFIAGALFGLIFGLTVCAYAAGVFDTGRAEGPARDKGRARRLLWFKR
jgi:hypothetical protein